MRAVNLLRRTTRSAGAGSRTSRADLDRPDRARDRAVGVLYFSAKSASTAKDLELQDAKAELALLPSPSELASETAGQRKLASERQARITALSAALSHRVAWDRVLREISLVLPDDVWLTQLAAFSPKPPTGTTPSATAPGAVPQGFTMAGYVLARRRRTAAHLDSPSCPGSRTSGSSAAFAREAGQPLRDHVHDQGRRSRAWGDVVIVTRRKVSPVVAAGIGVGIALILAAAGWFLLVSPSVPTRQSSTSRSPRSKTRSTPPEWRSSRPTISSRSAPRTCSGSRRRCRATSTSPASCSS